MIKRSTDTAFRCQYVLEGHGKAVSSVKFSPSGGLLATASADKSVCLWNATTGAKLNTLTGHTGGISDVAWNPNERYLCTASDDRTLKLWDAETGSCLRTLTGHSHYVFCCNFDAPGHLLASGSYDETMRLWDVRAGRCLREVPAHSDPLTAVNFAYDGTMVVSSSLDGLIRLWDTQTGHCLRTLYGRDSPPVSYATFSPNAKYVLCSTLDSRIRIWDYDKGRMVKTYEGGHVNKRFCVSAAFCTSDLGTWVVTGSEDNSVVLYDLDSQALVATIPGGAPVSKPAEGGPGAAQEVDSGAGVGTGNGFRAGGEGGAASGHTAPVLSVSVHPTLPVIASGANMPDNSVRVWAAVAAAESA